VKQQVENAPNVTTTKSGKMEKEKIETGKIKDTSVQNVNTVSVNRQSYQLNHTIVRNVKYA